MPPPHPADSDPHGIAASFEVLFLDEPPPDPGFQGESSVGMLVKAAVALKSGQPSIKERRAPASGPWTLRPWDKQAITVDHLSFPDSHLLRSLISLYFANVNIFIPVLHRPTFEEGVSQQLHTRQDDFASTLLLVCALGSLYLPDSDMSGEDHVKLAWTWYDQVELCGHSLRRKPTTCDLQAYCLAAHFLICTSNPRVSWTMVGFGLRIAQDIGSPRPSVTETQLSTEEELEKRATWRVDAPTCLYITDAVARVLILLDAQLATALGRLTTLNPFDLDIGLPSECDDEWWQPSGPGHQPQQAPSTVAFFNCIVGLYRILHFLLKNLYSTSRLYTASGIKDLLALSLKLDVTLNKWFSSIPPHLIWDPERPDGIFFDQSAALHCFYDYVRMLLHRPFIPAIGLTKQADPRALLICVKAARACINVADAYRLRRPDNPLFLSQDPLFTAAMVLILNMWGRAQNADERMQDLANVHIVLDIFKSQHKRWPSSGFFVTVLERLLAIDYIPAEQPEDELMSAAPNGASDANGSGSGPESWVTLARAWLAGTGAVLDVHSISTPDGLTMPPVFVGDQEVAPTQYHRLRALLDLKEASLGANDGGTFGQ
ncbi:Zn(2)-C6 fungal-type domain-containing protein [Mycena venus]|uniref:Zn(2)-C6 fungal-type domain-containing protein n=1 Tax=Mycena venus TaxID=2733690 RepID=A0A8H7D256_9AGAR|nr:Zn(2)-C6 fungal-type domain-containing protein [Mycena venus]